jgi:DNA-binding NarL/FixJ family response regulator
MSLGKVLIVEDERFTRTMLHTSLVALGFDVVGACATAQQALATVHGGEVDVALLDLDLGPGPSGIDVAYAIRAAQPSIGIVFLTSFRDPRIKDPGERVLPPGAQFLVKGSLDEVETLRDVILLARHKPNSRAVTEASDSELTAHQVTVLRQVAAGRTNSDIAAEMHVSEKAVERTIQRIAEALGIDRSAGNQRVLLARSYAVMSGKSLPSGD